MTKPNKAKIHFCLHGVQRIAEALPDNQRSALKDILTITQDMAKNPEPQNSDINLFASAIEVLSQSMYRYAKSFGNPGGMVRKAVDIQYADEYLQKAGLLPVPRNKQKFEVPVEPEEAPVEVKTAIPVEVKEQVEAELDAEAEAEETPEPPAPPKKKRKTRARNR